LIWQAYSREKDLEVRAAHAIALGGIPSLRSVKHLLAMIRLPKTADTEFIRRSAARSIGRVADALRSGKGVIDGANTSSLTDIQTADFAAGVSVFGSAANTLRVILRDTGDSIDVRREAAYALGAIGDRSSAPILGSLQDSADPFLSKNSKEALAKLALIR
jgi:HEAT repeat protein